MKAKLILLTLLMAVSAKGFAQDIIHTLENGRIESKVTEITDEQVRYKTFDNLDGPDYLISTSRVARIVFENGTEKVFPHKNAANPKLEEDLGPYGPIVYRSGIFYDDRGRLYSKQMRSYLSDTPFAADYKKARRQFMWGSGLTVGGSTLVLASVAGGTFFAIMNRGMDTSTTTNSITSKMPAVLLTMGLTGAACLGAGIPLWVSGNRKLASITDGYNLQRGVACSLTLGATGSGMGLALRF